MAVIEPNCLSPFPTWRKLALLVIVFYLPLFIPINLKAQHSLPRLSPQIFVIGETHTGSEYHENQGKKDYVQAEKLRKMKRYDEALIFYRKAIAADPLNNRYWFSRGKCHYVRRDYESAYRDFEQVSRLNPDFPFAWTLMAKIRRRQRRTKDAAACYAQAAKADTSSRRKVNYLLESAKLSMKDEDYANALNITGDAVLMDSENLNVHYFRARIFNKIGVHDRARDELEVIMPKLEQMKKNPGTDKYYYELGYAYGKLGDDEKMKEAYSKLKAKSRWRVRSGSR